MANIDQMLIELDELAPQERLKLLEKLIELMKLETGAPCPRTRSLLELRGLGRELWREVEVPAFLELERKAWV